MNDFFTDAHFIFLFRDIKATSESNFFKDDPDAYKRIKSTQKSMLQASAILDIKSLLINYEEINEGRNFMQKIEQFLNIKFNKQDFIKALKIKHSF